MKLNINQSSSQADPYVISHNNEYFMYVTGANGVDLYFSKDSLNWDRIGICYKKENEKQYWAPCVIELDGIFYMYVSSMPIGKEDTHEQRIQVAKSNSPYGPFEFIDFLIKPFSIDPHVVVSGNNLFMFYSTNNYDKGRVGTYVVVDKMLSPTKMNNNPQSVVVPTLDEEIFMKDRFKKGQHWHNSKWEFFIVVAGHGLIQERKIDTEEVIEFEVSGDHIQVVHILPGYTHNIINLSETENLVTVMWANEIFNPNAPDTFGEPV